MLQTQQTARRMRRDAREEAEAVESEMDFFRQSYPLLADKITAMQHTICELQDEIDSYPYRGHGLGYDSWG